MKNFVCEQLADALGLFKALEDNEMLHATLVAAAESTAQAMRTGHKLLIAGNGGSAADSQHLAAEFVSRLTVDRPAMRAIALTTDSSILTAVGNDYGYPSVFTRQLEALALPGDVFFGITTSGKSSNILAAIQLARTMNVHTIGLTGIDGSRMAPFCDCLISVPSSITQHIQEAHLALEHIFCGLVERFYFGTERFEKPHKAGVSAG